MNQPIEFIPGPPVIRRDRNGFEYVVICMPLDDGAKSYLAALRKVRQLETEIDQGHKDNMHHTLSKLWIFARELVPEIVRDRAHQIGAES